MSAESTDTPKKTLLRQGSSLGLFTLASRILGLVREMVKAAYMGTSPVSDAFSVAFLIPNLFRRLFAENSMSVAFIPTFRGFHESKDAQNTREFLSATFTLLSFLVTVTVSVGILAAPLIVPLFGTLTDETVLLTRVMFPYLAVISVAAFFQGILNGVHVFNPSGFTPILFNVIVISATVLLSPVTENPARAMAIGVLIGGTVQAAFQLPFIIRKGFRFTFTGLRAAFRNPGTRQVLRLIAPTIIGMAAYQINDIVSTALAGRAGTGVVSSLGYSLRLQELILGIFAVTIGTVILPGLSSFAHRGEWSDFYKRLQTALHSIALITIPIAFFAWLYGEEIIVLLFRSREFDDESVRLTLAAFRWHIVGLYFIAATRVLAPAFYAQKDSKSPTWAGVFNFAINITLAAVLVGPLAGGGIAMALSVASFANLAALFFLLRKKPQVPFRSLVTKTAAYALKMLLLSAAALVPVVLLKPVFVNIGIGFAESGAPRIVSAGLPLVLAALAFAAVGVGLLAATRDPQLAAVLAPLVRRLKRRTKK